MVATKIIKGYDDIESRFPTKLNMIIGQTGEGHFQ